MARVSLFGALAIMLMPLMSSLAAQATQRGNQRAQEMVDHAEQRLAQALTRAPRLAEIDAVIREDCAAKGRHITSDSEFCRCASAVTMMIWTLDPGGQMMPKLVDFANGRGDATAQSFLAYQGPELYRPLCSLAGP
jgi:hypothetical protein